MLSPHEKEQIGATVALLLFGARLVLYWFRPARPGRVYYASAAAMIVGLIGTAIYLTLS